MFLAALLLLLPPQDPSLAEALERLQQDAAGAPPARVLHLADAFLEPDDEAWVELLEEQLPGEDPARTLLLGRLLSHAGSTAAAGALGELLLEGDGEAARAALATLTLDLYQGSEEAQEALGTWLGTHAPEDDPGLWAEVALGLYRIGDGTRQRAGHRMLRDRSLDPDLEVRAAAALALARLGFFEEEGVLATLEELAGGLDARAVLARSLLERYEEKERTRRKMEALEKLALDRGPESQPALPEHLAMLVEVLRNIQVRHMEGDRFTEEELLAAAADGMLRRLDPHSNFLSSEEYAEFAFDLRPEYGGIGAFVNTVAGVFTITRPIYSGPAYEVGLRSGDQILEVDGWSTLGQPNDEIIKRLKGRPGTPVQVQIMRRGWTEPREFTIQRRRIEVPTLQVERLPGDVLYLELVSFSDQCGEHIREAIEEASREMDLSGVVLDLRYNPGGLLSQAVDVCDVFLPPGREVASTRTKLARERVYETRKPAQVPEDIPLVLLVNQYSASASEIVAGALAYHGRALTIGERTFGKGSVQNLIDLRSMPDEPWDDENRNGLHDTWERYEDRNGNGRFDYGPRIKLTIAYYYLPGGRSIHTLRDHDGRVLQEGGVQPDRVVPFPELDLGQLRELDRLLGENAFQDYARRLYAGNPEQAMALAEFDGRSTEGYPGWSEFYSSLQTDLPEDEVRRWVRLELRTLVSDARGKVFAGYRFRGDFEEDPQLQEAIKEILRRTSREIASIPEYAAVLLAAAETGAAGDEAGQEG